MREGWSFHTKGLWAELVGRHVDNGTISTNTVVNITCIGSSNLGERSLGKDMELGFLLVTENKALQDALRLETKRILKHCHKVSVPRLKNERYAVSSLQANSWLHSKQSIKMLSRIFRRVL